MSKKRGLSVEEKRSRMMEFFFEKKDFFQLKELEKLCQKEKGITSMSVKEILTSLVDDGMVDTDKIGTSVYFWAFPSKASQTMKKKINDLNKKTEDTLNRKALLEKLVTESKTKREDNEERDNILKELEKKKEENKRLISEVDCYQECDPDVIEGVKNQVVLAKETINRWTDNIFSTKSWIKRKFAFEDRIIDKQFGIPEDFDYIS
ncbi:meiotic nuclear division protein 1 homolog [Octopus bimaculoides]|uniref:Meiotic nuclear division protein 1 homolog n=1 Tax=Octopus bimaculoides TaxID=37653 RepID=A0A0L8I9X4_OCTBM|nr:meiotic nuclear division protein 1 homolog [Octopus bimaculoides]|eukprot:XP_014782807.1 PREDICTED: meiotic nuclear division protein 1 homolog isoform X1 [Octopus bimaculoides]